MKTLAIPCFTRLNTLEQLRCFIKAVGREQHGNRLPDDLLGRVAENALGGWIPASHDATQVFTDYSVIAGGNDGSE